MQYKTGTVAVTNGNNGIIGTGTLWLASVTIGSVFSVAGSGVPYIVANVVDDTHITLASNYGGTTLSGLSYAITTSFTPNQKLPYPEATDIDTHTIVKRAMLQVDTMLGAVIGGAAQANRVLFTDANGNLTTNAALTVTGSGGILASGGGAPVATGNGVQIWSNGPNQPNIAFIDGSRTANNRLFTQFFSGNTFNFAFINDSFGSVATPLTFSGGQALGITGITSNSGSGAWAHTGAFSTTGKIGIGGATPAQMVTIAADHATQDHFGLSDTNGSPFSSWIIGIGAGGGSNQGLGFYRSGSSANRLVLQQNEITVGGQGITTVGNGVLNVVSGFTSTTLKNNIVARFAANASGADVTLNLTDAITNNGFISLKGGQLYFNSTSDVANFSGAVGINVSPTGRFHVLAAGGDAQCGFFVHPTAANDVLSVQASSTAGNPMLIQFYTEASPTARGSIDYNRGGGVVRFNTTSDGELKVIIGDAPKDASLTILRDTRMREYYWKADTTRKPQIGPIAQELVRTFKGAVGEGGYRRTYDGRLAMSERYQPWSVDKTAFVNHLVVGWQDHDARLAAIEKRLGQL